MTQDSITTLIIEGQPVAYMRPRAAARGRKATVYTPAKLEQWYQSSAVQLRLQWGATPPLTGPLRVDVVAVCARPASLPASLKSIGFTSASWRACTERTPKLTAPDADNFLKSALDALQRAGVIHDDRLVVDARVVKCHAAPGEDPHLEVTLYAISLSADA